MFAATKKVFSKIDAKEEAKKPLPTDTKDGTHNRFGFKLRKNEATHVILKKQPTFSRYVKFSLQQDYIIIHAQHICKTCMYNIYSVFY